MRYRILVGAAAVAAAALICIYYVVRASHLPLTASGHFEDGSNSYAYEAHYWGLENQLLDGVPAKNADAAPFAALEQAILKVTTFEELCAYHTADSRPILEAHREGMEKGIERMRHRTNPSFRIFYLTVAVDMPKGQEVFAVFGSKAEPITSANMPFSVMAFRKEADGWKRDISQNRSRIYQALSLGKWKLFGLPIDLSSPDYHFIDEPTSAPAATQPAAEGGTETH